MKMTPIKKLVICIAAVSVAMTVITTNILSSVLTLKATQNNMAREKALMQQIEEHNNSSNNGGYVNSGSSNGGYVSTTPGGSSSSSNGGSSNSGSNGGSNGGSSADSNTPAGNNNAGSQDAGEANAEGLKMYVDALNKAKSSATTVVKTKTSASHYKEHLVIEGNAIIKATLEPIGKSLMGTFMKASEPNETIDKNALPPQGIQCTLTDADLAETPKVEKSGDNTVITLVLKGGSDPKPGSGLGSAVSIIEEKTITDAVAGAIEISNIHLDYDACTIIATLDASGNLIGLSVNAPCILKLTAMGVNAEVGIECYDEYTIAY